MAFILNTRYYVSVPPPIDMYSPGDEVFIDYISLGGYVTGSGTNYYFSISLPKPISALVKSITVKSGSGRIRQENHYLFGSADTAASLTTFDGVAECHNFTADPPVLAMRLAFNTAPEGYMNNSAFGIELQNLVLSFN